MITAAQLAELAVDLPDEDRRWLARTLYRRYCPPGRPRKPGCAEALLADLGRGPVIAGRWRQRHPEWTTTQVYRALEYLMRTGQAERVARSKYVKKD